MEAVLKFFTVRDSRDVLELEDQPPLCSRHGKLDGTAMGSSTYGGSTLSSARKRVSKL